MKPFYRFEKGYGHYCGPTKFGSYKMIEEWVDVDNKVWAEPYHLYTFETHKIEIDIK